MKKLIAIIGIIVIVVLSGRALLYRMALRPVDADDSTRISVTIPPGSSTSRIGEILEDEGIIRSGSAFARYAEKSDTARQLQAGSFVLSPGMSVEDVVNALTSKAAAEQSVTIPEGFTVKDIDNLLAEKGLIQPGDVIDCANTCDFASFDFLPSGTGQAERGGKLEGYLFPDTYFISTADFVPKFFLERMLGTFRTRVVDGMKEDIRASGHTLHEVVTMASLIEEETRTDEERPVVAGILWKRIGEGIGLYVDASNRYILNKPTAAITAADLEQDTPYNLRRYRGLPPGPIANPSLKSLQAALNPETSPYYYYLHGTDGQIRYAVTNDEHNINRARYLR